VTIRKQRRYTLNIQQMLTDLREELGRIGAAILALEGLNGSGRPGPRTRTTKSSGRSIPTRGRRTISAAGRRRIAAAQRARWAALKGKKAGATKRATTAKTGATRHVSAAARRKMAAAQKARWAKIKTAKKAA